MERREQNKNLQWNVFVRTLEIKRLQNCTHTSKKKIMRVFILNYSACLIVILTQFGTTQKKINMYSFLFEMINVKTNVKKRNNNSSSTATTLIKSNINSCIVFKRNNINNNNNNNKQINNQTNKRKKTGCSNGL